MVLQMPRFGTQKMCERIFINPQLDLTNILYTSEKHCHICNERASCMCKDCSGKSLFGAKNRNVFLCKPCMELTHRHPDRAQPQHKWNEIELCKEPINYDKDSLTMELFAVVCINTSHYVMVFCHSSFPFWLYRLLRLITKVFYVIKKSVLLIARKSVNVYQ